MYDVIHAAIARDRTHELVESANVTRAARETRSPVPPRKVTVHGPVAPRVSLVQRVLRLHAH
jgi:hypothetical protein